jgi:hypothetical protein
MNIPVKSRMTANSISADTRPNALAIAGPPSDPTKVAMLKTMLYQAR